jgi:hypothetical protein
MENLTTKVHINELYSAQSGGSKKEQVPLSKYKTQLKNVINAIAFTKFNEFQAILAKINSYYENFVMGDSINENFLDEYIENLSILWNNPRTLEIINQFKTERHFPLVTFSEKSVPDDVDHSFYYRVIINTITRGPTQGRIPVVSEKEAKSDNNTLQKIKEEFITLLEHMVNVDSVAQTAEAKKIATELSKLYKCGYIDCTTAGNFIFSNKKRNQPITKLSKESRTDHPAYASYIKELDNYAKSFEVDASHKKELANLAITDIIEDIPPVVVTPSIVDNQSGGGDQYYKLKYKKYKDKYLKLKYGNA